MYYFTGKRNRMLVKHNMQIEEGQVCFTHWENGHADE